MNRSVVACRGAHRAGTAGRAIAGPANDVVIITGVVSATSSSWPAFQQRIDARRPACARPRAGGIAAAAAAAADIVVGARGWQAIPLLTVASKPACAVVA